MVHKLYYYYYYYYYYYRLQQVAACSLGPFCAIFFLVSHLLNASIR